MLQTIDALPAIQLQNLVCQQCLQVGLDLPHLLQRLKGFPPLSASSLTSPLSTDHEILGCVLSRDKLDHIRSISKHLEDLRTKRIGQQIPKPFPQNPVPKQRVKSQRCIFSLDLLL